MNRKLLAALGLAAALWAPLAVHAAPPDIVTIRFSELGTVSTGNLYQYLALEKGIYKSNGIDLQIVHFLRGGPESIAAAASNQVDMGSVGTPVLTAISRGVHLKVVGAPAYKVQPFVLVGRPDVRSVADLKGKDVAFGDVGGGAVEAARYIFAANGVDPGSVNDVGGGSTSSGFLALKSGRVAAVVLGEPYVTLAQSEGVGRVLARAEDYFGRYEHSYIFATQQFIASHPDAIRRFFVANREAIRYAKAHPDELYAYGLKKLNLDPRVFRSVLDAQMARWDDSGEVDEQGLLNAVKIVQQVGDISRSYQPSIAQITDLRFVSEANAPVLAQHAGDRVDGAAIQK
jgi:NitT/TauT family transport system substrate-binding protein